MVKTLFFDLTDTLQNFDWSKQWPLLQEIIQKETSYKITIDELKKYYQQTYEFYRIGKIRTDLEFFDLLFKQMALNVTSEQIEKIVPQHLEMRKQFTWLPDKYDETLTALRKHFKLAIVSSGVWPWGDYDYEKIFGFEMGKHFDLITNSYVEGFLKDSGKLFEIAFEKLNVKPGDVAFVGDNYEKDILLAKKFGMKTVFLNKKNESLEGDITIEKLSDLLELVEELKNL
jgi:putative hydrolase of the HAD superfamily